MLNIAFCINDVALAGLGVTLSSLIRNSSDSSRIKIYFLCSNLNTQHKQNITKLLTDENFKGSACFIDFNAVAEFGHLRSLHGDWTAYGRLLISDLVSVDLVLYLDADLIIEYDIINLLNFDIQGQGLAAVAGAKLKFALDHPFLHYKLGIPLDTDYFNSGVLILNLAYWRSMKVKEQLLTLAKLYANELISHDQTLLNALFGPTFVKLPPDLNCPWYADKVKPNVSTRMILHFLGSPKPWDIGGKYLHNGYTTWVKYLDKTWAQKYSKTTFDDILRAWKIRRSYAKLIRKKLKK